MNHLNDVLIGLSVVIPLVFICFSLKRLEKKIFEKDDNDEVN